MKKISLEDATAKLLEGKLLKENSLNYEDYICLKFDESSNSMTIYFFDRSLTYGDLDQIKSICDSGDYDSYEDRIEAIDEIAHIVSSINIDSDDVIYV